MHRLPTRAVTIYLDLDACQARPLTLPREPAGVELALAVELRLLR